MEYKMLKRYVIERDIPGVGTLTKPELGAATDTSNDALSKLAPKVQWQHSYVAANKTFCIYLADSREAIEKHAEISGFPANIITEITGIIDPTTRAA
jgi:hypothetical protein